MNPGEVGTMFEMILAQVDTVRVSALPNRKVEIWLTYKSDMRLIRGVSFAETVRTALIYATNWKEQRVKHEHYWRE